MTTSITSPEGIINLALGRIKYPMRIGSIWEGSKPSKAALDIYGQTRDDLLRTQDWPFARRDAPLTLLNQAPAGGYVPPTTWDPAIYPPLPWAFQYSYPSDSLRIRAIRPVDLFLVNYDPREHRFTVTNDDSVSPAVKTILCNVGPVAVATYSGRLTDPTTFDADFTEAFAEALARRLAPVLTDMEAAKVAGAYETQATNEADICQAG
jgi:hypothetical protein